MTPFRRAVLLVLVAAVLVPPFLVGEDNPPTDSNADGRNALTKNLVPMYRFYDSKSFKHMYSMDETELATWRANTDFKEQKIIGLISPTDFPKSQRLWRAIRDKDRAHYYYITAPKQANRITVDSERFKAYVWPKLGDGRIPVYATSWTDGTDVYLDTDLKAVEKFISDSKKALGVNRLQFGGAKLKPIFYIFPYTEPKDSSKE